MWFFGFSTKFPRNLWTIGAISLVILATLLLKKILVHLEAQKAKSAHNLHVKKEGGEQYRETLKSIAIVRTYALEELRVATRYFSVQIGVGATSKVYLAELGDGRFGAVKRVMEERGGSKKVLLDEVSVLLRISHPNLVGLMGFCMEKGEQLLLLEYVPNKSLFERMHTYEGQRSGILSWPSRLSIALDIARALNYLHFQADPPIIHRDVKSSNILLIDDMHAKLADLGLCKLGCQNINGLQTPTIVKGSLGYIDTHYLQTGLLSISSDVYSFGVLLLELITGLKSTQGSVTLAECTYEWRKNEDIEVIAKMLDPKLVGAANLKQVRVLVNVANAALLEDFDARPDMNHIVDIISSCMQPQLSPHLYVMEFSFFLSFSL